MFDIQLFLEDEQIEYWAEGKNVLDNHVNVNCPFCDDPSNHLGFDIAYPLNPKCWRCGDHWLGDFLIEMGYQVTKMYGKYDKDAEDIGEVEVKSKVVREVILPPQCQEFSNREAGYLRMRGFDPHVLQSVWNLYGGGLVGEYKFRIIIPVYYYRRLVAFQGRDITDRQEEKYMTCQGVEIKDYLYGMNYVYNDRVIIVEGVSDVWRLGRGNAVATFGVEYTMNQVILLYQRGIKHALIFFDAEPHAQAQAEKLQADLQALDINAWCFYWREGDPADMNQSQVQTVIERMNLL